MTKKRHLFRLISCLERQIFEFHEEILIHNPNDTNELFGVKPSAIRCQQTVLVALFHRSQPECINSQFEKNHCFQFSINWFLKVLHPSIPAPVYNRSFFLTHAGTWRDRNVWDQSYMLSLVSFMICSV